MTKEIEDILLVDDSALIRKAIGLLLRRNSYTVEDAQNGLQALHLAEKRKFDLILLDYEMPLMTGYEVLLLLKASDDLQDIPVVMLSGKSDKEQIIQCLKDGAHDFIVKSNDMNILLNKIKELNQKMLKMA